MSHTIAIRAARLTLAVGLAIAVATLNPTTAGSTPAPRQTTAPGARVTNLDVRAASGQRTRAAALPRQRTSAFAMVGVTWAVGASPARVEVQVRHGGQWTRWLPLRIHGDSSAGGRPGTDPLWVGRSDAVAVRTEGSARGLQVSLVDPGPDPDVDPALRLAADGTPTYTPMPAMVSRAGWGARAPKYCDYPRLADHVDGVIFHHTAGSNRYSRADAPRIVRGIQAYHMSGQGWCDIGYNFLIDKYGVIYEGRSGGVLPQVRGAHAGNFTVNTYAMGVSMMGNLDRVAPSTAMKSAAVRLIGWRLGTNYLPATGTYPIAGHALPRIAGHRDVRRSGISPSTATACPGRYGYSWMRTGLRARVAAYISAYDTVIRRRTAQLGEAVTGRVRVGEYPSGGGHKTEFAEGTLYARSSAWWVTGPLLAAYVERGEETGPLGFPTGDAVTTPTGAEQSFENGTLVCDAATGIVTQK